MKLSIIVPVYNVEKYLYRCLESCIKQDIPYNEYEIIIVNDGSKDNSLNIAEDFYHRYEKNVKLLNQPNAGLSAARNKGMDVASGDYFFFVDSDDWIAEYSLGFIVKLLDQNKPDCMAFCMADYVAGQYVRRINYKDGVISGMEFLKQGAVDNAQYTIWSKNFLKKNCLRFCSGILHEDSEFTPRAYYLARSVLLTNEILYYVYPNPQSITRGVNYKRSFDYVNHVCVNLSSFSKMAKTEDRIIFDKRISMYFNNALNVCYKAPYDVKRDLNKAIFKNRSILIHLWKAGSLKYRTEYVLMKLFPFSYTVVYSCLRRLK